MQPAAKLIVRNARDILRDAEAGEFDDEVMLKAIRFAQFRLAVATRLTMRRFPCQPAMATRAFTLPEDLIDLDTVYLTDGIDPRQ